MTLKHLRGIILNFKHQLTSMIERRNAVAMGHDFGWIYVLSLS